MSKIKDTQSAKIGLSGMFGTPSTQTGGLSPLEDRPLSTREEMRHSRQRSGGDNISNPGDLLVPPKERGGNPRTLSQ